MMGDSNGGSLIEIDDQEKLEDPFLAFIDYARAVISPEEDEYEEAQSKRDITEAMTDATGPGWGWIASRILKTCTAYSSGVTAAILLSDLSQVLLNSLPPTIDCRFDLCKIGFVLLLLMRLILKCMIGKT